MRVITGSARGRKLSAPEGLDTRPSSDMTKQAVFNIIQNYIENSTFLDLFAGSGQVGIEALSRGAQSVTFIDNRVANTEIIKENLKMCGFMEKSRVAMMDAIAFLENSSSKFEIAYLDPPYQKGLNEKALPLLVDIMDENGIILCETERNEILPERVKDFAVSKSHRYGKAKVTVYRRAELENEEE